MKLTLSKIRGQLGRLLRDNGLNSSQFDPIAVTAAIRFACDQLAKQTGCSYTETAIATAGGKSTLPSLISVVRIFYQNGAVMKLLQKTSMAFEDSKDVSWRLETGTPSLWMDFSGNQIRLNRIPPGGSQVVIGFIERPAEMTTESDFPDDRIPEHYHPFLKYAAAAFLLNQAGTMEDLAKADKFMAQFNNLIGAGPTPVASAEVDR